MAAVESEQGSSFEGPELAPYPAYVQTDDERRRWDAAYGIASGVSALHEAGGEPDPRFTWLGTRALYNSEYPTSGDGLAEALEEAGSVVLEPGGEHLEADPGYRVRASERARELIGAAEAARLLGDHESAAELAADALDTLLGDPDHWPDELPGRVMAEVAYAERMHPRDRIGKWSHKLGGVARSARNISADAVAGVHMKAAVARSTLGGGALHGDERKMHREARLRRDAGKIAARTGKTADEVQHLVTKHVTAEHAQEERNRRGARGARQKVKKAKTIAAGTTLSTIHRVLAAPSPLDEKVEKQVEKYEKGGGRRNLALAVPTAAAGFYMPDPRQSATGATPSAGGDTAEDLEKIREHSKHAIELARWAHEHREHLRVVGHIVKHAAQAVGLAGAAAEPEDPYATLLDEAGLEARREG